jgi:hypothetical protein
MIAAPEKMETLGDLGQLLEGRPQGVFINACADNKEIFRTIGGLAWKGVLLDRFCVSGCILIQGDQLAVGMHSLRKGSGGAKMKMLRIVWGDE